MATAYHVFTTGDAPVATRARKDAAIKFGDNLNEPYRIVTDSGKLVHEVAVSEPEQAEPEQAEPEQAEPEQAEPEQAEPEQAEPEQAEPEQADRKSERKFDVSVMKAKIAKLLAKAEGTDNEDERRTYNEKATALMIKLGVDKAELESAGKAKTDKIIEERRRYQSVYAMTQVHFAHSVAQGFGDLTTLQSGRWADATLFVIGHETDVRLFMQLLDSLELQVMSALKAWKKADPEHKLLTNYERLVASRSFIKGYGLTVRDRLATTRKQTQQEASTGAALVLASKQARVDEWVSAQYQLGKGRASGRRTDYRAAQAGKVAGQKADIGGKRVDGGAKGQLG